MLKVIALLTLKCTFTTITNNIMLSLNKEILTKKKQKYPLKNKMLITASSHL